MQLALFYPKAVQRFYQKSENHGNSGSCMLFVTLWSNAYKNRYVIHPVMQLNKTIVVYHWEFCNALVLTLLLNITCVKSSKTKSRIRSLYNYSQWTNPCRFTIDSTSRFHVESSSKWHRFWKANPHGIYNIDSAWKFRRWFDFQTRRNIDEFSAWIFRHCFNVKST